MYLSQETTGQLERNPKGSPRRRLSMYEMVSTRDTADTTSAFSRIMPVSLTARPFSRFISTTTVIEEVLTTLALVLAKTQIEKSG